MKFEYVNESDDIKDGVKVINPKCNNQIYAYYYYNPETCKIEKYRSSSDDYEEFKDNPSKNYKCNN